MTGNITGYINGVMEKTGFSLSATANSAIAGSTWLAATRTLTSGGGGGVTATQVWTHPTRALNVGATLASTYDAAKVASSATAVAAIAASLTTVDANVDTALVNIADLHTDVGTALTNIGVIDGIVDNILRWFTNKRTVTASTQVLYGDNSTTAAYTQTLTDDGTTVTRNKAT
jgi:hypothetical protein